ncbi:cell division protein FtsA, partial [bacterium]|nr:cell division protein FtsA [bacterium]
MARSDFTIAAIDAGTTTVRAVIAACRAGEGIRIAGVGTMPSDGVTKSTIIDSAAFVPIARGAMEGAERDARIQVDDVFVTIGGGHVHSTNVAAVLPILDSDETVHEEHIEQLLEKAKGNSAEKGREFLHTIPQEYRLGSHAGVLNPVGLQAARIEAGVHVITADRTILENHCRAFNDAGFRVADVCFSVIAGGACILSEQDKKDGVLLVDIGGGSCSYAVYFNNTVYYSNVFAVGGDHIT